MGLKLFPTLNSYDSMNQKSCYGLESFRLVKNLELKLLFPCDFPMLSEALERSSHPSFQKVLDEQLVIGITIPNLIPTLV